MTGYSNRYEAFMGMAPRDIPHWEHWSCPDAATYITGIDYYSQPKSCMKKLNQMYPKLSLGVPESDEPRPRPEEQADKGKGRWGDGYRDYWQQEKAGCRFSSREEMLKFSPLEQGDFSGWNVVVDGDFSSEDVIYRRYRKKYDESWGDAAPEGSTASVSFYNTMFMWPLLVFGYENFLQICLEPEFERIMDEFAEINRRVFRAFARLPVNFAVCHDDIVLSSGPVCSPKWMHRFIFPRYEEFWGILKDAGKEVIFMVDGCVDAFVDDVMACGARGIISEPFTNYRAIRPIIHDFFEMGADILNPIQVRAEGMNVEELAHEYRGKIAFYGGVDTQELLVSGPEKSIRDEVRRLFEIFGLQGGFILSGSQGLLEDIPYGHAVAMLEENLRCFVK